MEKLLGGDHFYELPSSLYEGPFVAFYPGTSGRGTSEVTFDLENINTQNAVVPVIFVSEGEPIATAWRIYFHTSSGKQAW